VQERILLHDGTHAASGKPNLTVDENTFLQTDPATKTCAPVRAPAASSTRSESTPRESPWRPRLIRTEQAARSSRRRRFRRPQTTRTP
jgi:hypothetical protein